MNLPRCPKCRTDEHLRYLHFQPSSVDVLTFGTHGGHTIEKHIPKKPVVEYECSKCGYFNGHSVPDDWVPPEG